MEKMLVNFIWKSEVKMRKRDLQIFHIIKANENIRSKVRSNFVTLNIPVERMRIDKCYSFTYTSNVEDIFFQDISIIF